MLEHVFVIIFSNLLWQNWHAYVSLEIFCIHGDFHKLLCDFIAKVYRRFCLKMH